MFISRFLGGALVLVVAATGWRYRSVWMDAPEPPSAAFTTQASAWPDAGTAPSAGGVPEAGSVQQLIRRAAPTPVGGPHKCRKGKRVIYTEGGCPEGTEELAIQGGTVTVVPPTPGARTADAADAPGVRAEKGQKVIASPLIAPYVQNDGPNIRQQTIERAVQQ